MPRHVVHRIGPLEQRPITQIFILGEHAIYRDGLRSLLETEPDFSVVGQATSCAEAVALVRQGRPDILLLDLATTTLPNCDALITLASACTTARVMMLMPSLKSSDVAEAVRFGVRGVLVKAVTAELLIKSIRAVTAGQYWLERQVVADLAHRLHTAASSAAEAPPRKRFGLTRRELEIVSLLATGRGNREIANKCGISQRTVKQHLTNLFDKLGLSNRLELALFALQERLVTPESVEPSPNPAPQ